MAVTAHWEHVDVTAWSFMGAQCAI